MVHMDRRARDENFSKGWNEASQKHVTHSKGRQDYSAAAGALLNLYGSARSDGSDLPTLVWRKLHPPSLGGVEGYLTIGHVLDLVASLEEAASFHYSGGLDRFFTVTGRLDPSVVYFHQVLSVWSWVGGKTSLPTRDLKTGKLDNDLYAFFS